MANVQLAVAGDDNTQVILSVPGVQGPAGSNLPPSGTTNQVLFKQSNTDYDTGWSLVTSAMIASGTIVNEDVNASAAIAGTKISPDFGSQNVVTTGTSTAASFIPTSSSVPTNGVYLPSANNVAISTNGTGRLFVDSSGRVGVGVSPSARLEVNGESRFTRSDASSQYVGIIADGTDTRIVAEGSSKNLTIKNNSTTSSAILFDQAVASLYVFQQAGTERFRVRADGTFEIKGGGTAGVTPAVSVNPSASANSLVIDSSGRLGLGTSSPQSSARLHVYATGDYTDESAPFTVGDSTAGGMRLFFGINNTSNYGYIGSVESSTAYRSLVLQPGGGNVGIGVTSPGYALDIASSVAQVGNSTDAFIQYKSTAGNWHVGANSSNAYVFYSGTYGTGSERARIDSSGRLGIGTATPGLSGSNRNAVTINAPTGQLSILEFAVNNSLTGYLYSNTSQTTLNSQNTPLTFDIQGERARIDTSGRFGIGTSSPQGLLSIYKGSTAAGIARATRYSLPFADGSNNGISIEIGREGNNSNVGAAIQMAVGNYAGSSASYIAFKTSPATVDTSTDTSQERVRIDDSGRLLVGTSSARTTFFGAGYTSALQVETASVSNPNGLSIGVNTNDDNPANLYLFKTRGTSVGSNTAVQNGDVLGNISFIGANGTDVSNTAAWIRCIVDGVPFSSGDTTDLPGALVFSTTADSASSPTERMRISNSGAILLGCTTAPNPGAGSTTSGFAVNGTDNNAYLTAKIDNGAVGYFRRDGTDGTLFDIRKGSTTVGTISVTASATAYNTSSDYRLKENVVPLTGALDRLNQLQVHRFNFIADPDTTVDGFIAHEAQAVVPECVTGAKDEVDADGNPVYQGIDQSKLVPLLTAALQEAIGRIETLEAEVAALKAS